MLIIVQDEDIISLGRIALDCRCLRFNGNREIICAFCKLPDIRSQLFPLRRIIEVIFLFNRKIPVRRILRRFNYSITYISVGYRFGLPGIIVAALMTVTVHAALIFAVGICHGKAFDGGKVNGFVGIRNLKNGIHRLFRHKVSTEAFNQVLDRCTGQITAVFLCCLDDLLHIFKRCIL